MSTLFWISYIALWIVIVPLVVLNLILFRQLGIMIMGTARGINQSGIPAGRRLPSVQSTTIDGQFWSTEHLHGHPHLVFFALPTCRECSQILPDVRRVRTEFGVTPVIMMLADRDDARNYARRHKVDCDVVHISQRDADTFDVTGTPFAYAVDSEGLVRGKGLVNSRAALHMICQAAVVGAGSPQ